MVRRGHGKEPTYPPDDRGIRYLLLVLLLRQHAPGGEHQERTEQVEDPVVAGDERCSEEDHRPPHDQRPHDAPEKHAMLVLRGHPHVLEDHRDHEDVVRAQRDLDHVAGEELHGRQTAVVHHAIELVDVRPESEPVILVQQVHQRIEPEGRTNRTA
jgi:hypothetical protein